MRYLITSLLLVGFAGCSVPEKQSEPIVVDSAAVTESDTLSATIDSVTAEVDDILKELE